MDRDSGELEDCVRGVLLSGAGESAGHYEFTAAQFTAAQLKTI